MNYFGSTDIGCVRQNNQDYFRIDPFGTHTLFTVCDGMGGAAGGAAASKLACDVFAHAVEKTLSESEKISDQTLLHALSAALSEANQAVFSLANAEKTLAGMGTTLCAVLVSGTDSSRLCAVSVGDSRIYLFKDEKITQLSHDHSYVQALVDNGTITPDESKNHPNKNIITRAVGTTDAVEGDCFLLDFDADGFLLCSDGLTGFVSDDELNARFRQYTNAEETVKALIDDAKRAGGGDNITAVLARR
ncbi:MAG: Stp1/IreP family PP2C-type Ser/Thr phosphatase [Eubacteriales bacterium]|jgi:serine/threonine protein phosphatase PrpC